MFEWKELFLQMLFIFVRKYSNYDKGKNIKYIYIYYIIIANPRERVDIT